MVCFCHWGLKQWNFRRGNSAGIQTLGFSKDRYLEYTWRCIAYVAIINWYTTTMCNPDLHITNIEKASHRHTCSLILPVCTEIINTNKLTRVLYITVRYWKSHFTAVTSAKYVQWLWLRICKNLSEMCLQVASYLIYSTTFKAYLYIFNCLPNNSYRDLMVQDTCYIHINSSQKKDTLCLLTCNA